MLSLSRGGRGAPVHPMLTENAMIKTPTLMFKAETLMFKTQTLLWRTMAAGLAGLSLAAMTPTIAQEKIMSEYEHILEPVRAYVDGAHRKERALLERAFDVDNAQMKSIGEDGGTRAMAIREVIENIWLQGDPIADYYMRVMSFRLLDEDMATVEIDNNGVFVDQLTLFRIGGEWRIVDKVFLRQ